MARTQAGDFKDALVSLREAAANYAKAEKLSDAHEFAMIQVKNEAQTRFWIAVTLFQSGQTLDAVTTIEATLPQLTRVRSDESIPVGIRDDAARWFRDAQNLLTHFKSAQ